MENLTETLESIVNQSNTPIDKHEQISKFDETIKMFEGIDLSEKPSYNLPHVDTLGRDTYLSLNKKQN